MSCCASCGVKESEGDDVKLRDCTACHLVKYCSIACQKDHRSKHKRACKERVAELRDELLFKQPESSYQGDCPICFLPLPMKPTPTIMPCCGKIICRGCDYANTVREIEEKLVVKCAFCRTPVPKSEKESDKWLHDRADKMNDPVAMREVGIIRYEEGDYQNSFRYLSKAVELGDIGAHYQLAYMHFHGRGVEKDEKKALYHYEQAAIGGHPHARHNLGGIEWKNRRYERAVKHFIIAANLGFDDSLAKLKKSYKAGIVSKDDFAAALRGHQAAVDATKSSQRQAVEAFDQVEGMMNLCSSFSSTASM